MIPPFWTGMAVSQGAFGMLKSAHVGSKPKWTSFPLGRSWLFKLATTKIGLQFLSRVCANGSWFCRWTNPLASNSAKQRWIFAK
jgi:hypothetical protein